MSNINDRIDALMERHGLEPAGSTIPVAFGTKRNVKVGTGGYLLQRFPVTLYGPSWLRFLREENIEKILTFLEENEDGISWEKDS
jgi:hypothetical protein